MTLSIIDARVSGSPLSIGADLLPLACSMSAMNPGSWSEASGAVPQRAL